MDKKTTGILVAGLLLTILLYFVNIYAAGIIFVLVIAIVMALMIMQDTMFQPQIAADLREDARAIVLTNKGNSPAEKIHVVLVPMNIEFDLPSLAVDTTYEYPVASMVDEVKVVVRYENEKGQPFSYTESLSSRGEKFDPLKPMIPVFGYK